MRVHRLSSHKWRITLLAVALLTFLGVVTLLAFGNGGQRAAASKTASAINGMSAMHRTDNLVREMPAAVERLPANMLPERGTVHKLVSDLGEHGFSLYAWRGEGGSVCYVSTSAGGGCFAEFLGPFDISITDFDRLGSGAPVTVSGPVRDDVVGIEVMVAGKKYEALVENNVAFFELPDAEDLPSAIQGVTALLEDGTTENVRI
jgi:hypothetical protein